MQLIDHVLETLAVLVAIARAHHHGFHALGAGDQLGYSIAIDGHR
jgi:hypothetical protein